MSCLDMFDEDFVYTGILWPAIKKFTLQAPGTMAQQLQFRIFSASSVYSFDLCGSK